MMQPTRLIQLTAVCGVLAASAGAQPPRQPDAQPFHEGRAAGDQWVNGVGMVFCWCPAGRFTMGSPLDTPGRGDDEGPVEVTITHGYWIGKYELTRGQAKAIDNRLPRKALGTESDQPLDSLHYDDMNHLLRALNESERKAGRLPDGWEYALPTEAQWEYAARAGTTTRFYFGDDPADLPRHANFADRSLYDTADSYYGYADHALNDGEAGLARVGRYRPSPWGLYDVYGNVWEWCETRYSPGLVGGVDPVGPDAKNAGGYVARGGSWCSTPGYCRSAFRHSFESRAECNFLGYRLVLRRVRPHDDKP